MPLIPCPDCGRKISTAADSCPQCGRPNDVVTRRVAQDGDLKCYGCNREATTKCMRCGALSCPEHLQPVGRGKAGNELLCVGCEKQVRMQQQWAVWIAILVSISVMGLALVVSANKNAKPKPPPPIKSLPPDFLAPLLPEHLRGDHRSRSTKP